MAFGLWSGSPPDRFHVGLAVLGLLSEVAAERPLLCLIDDAQWLDQASAQALAFVARRLDAESVAVLFGTRDPAAAGELAGLPELVLAGLSDADARALLASVVPGRLDERVRDRIVAESGGNPLAPLELPHGATAAEMAGGFGLPGAGPLPGRIEDIFRRRIAPLPEMTQRLLLLAAAEPVGDPALLWRVAAEADRLLTVADRVTFRHPLVRAVELIEAATRSGVPEQAAGALERLSDSARASGSDWAPGIEARSRALLGDGETAELLYREAIDRLGRTRVRVALARAHLLYGEWLRRENQRIDAREQLRTAHEMFASMGADGFAERAARELAKDRVAEG